jgi:hypothetical protein
MEHFMKTFIAFEYLIFVFYFRGSAFYFFMIQGNSLFYIQQSEYAEPRQLNTAEVLYYNNKEAPE